eukprot:CAMPEP_0201486690 /NCGR_PEP_ID=MMETSP0151_2-20130828/10745_1 /ASSEMBLY_ACC=CAM_ASM_000257 /TAXON_ID=200890 /ORGANISM="Paramoeba atlantica, Strain 621/1 / CCAP 1560/9" /LENGTH=526 /DNA_ID=CAMNT_0047871471 /DNA_START=144 /DNA_END=1721 /DNA_ORIENTATION=+
MAARQKSIVGMSLEDLMKQQGCGYIPDVIQQSLEFLSRYMNEPLFRKPPPGDPSWKEVDTIVESYDEGKMDDLGNFTTNPQTVCSLMVLFLESLPEPLLPKTCFAPVLDALKKNDLRAARATCDHLPEYNHALSDCIFQFLYEGTENGVELEDLGRLGPVLFGPKQNEDDSATVVKYLIQNVDELFGIQRIGELTDFYDVVGDLGSGTYAVAKKVIHKETGLPYAVKIIQKKHLEQRERDKLTMETNILKRVRHPNVIALKAVCETEDELFLIMELAEGGELFQHIVANEGAYSEDVAIDIVKQIVGAVSYLHDLNIVHRDLKPENILLKRKGTLELKLADFGLSKMFDSTVRMQTTCGSPAYVAPEVLTDEQYGREVDMWSVGVIAYVILSGIPPFYSSNIKELFQKIMIAKYDFPVKYWSSQSDAAIDFVRKLLVKNAGSRMSASMALKHRWLTRSQNGSGILSIGGDIKSIQALDKKQRQEVAEEVAQGPNTRVREVTGVEHNFKSHNYFKPSWCEICGEFLW